MEKRCIRARGTHARQTRAYAARYLSDAIRCHSSDRVNDRLMGFGRKLDRVGRWAMLCDHRLLCNRVNTTSPGWLNRVFNETLIALLEKRGQSLHFKRHGQRSEPIRRLSRVRQFPLFIICIVNRSNRMERRLDHAPVKAASHAKFRLVRTSPIENQRTPARKFGEPRK